MIKLDQTSAIRSLTKASFYDFVKEFWHAVIAEEPVFNWHIKLICDELQEAAERVFVGKHKKHDIILNVPPGSTKSTLCSQMFVAWVWTRMPSARFICASYAHQLALKDSLKTRDIIRCELYQRCFPEIQLRPDEDTKELFSNTQKGMRLSAGIGGRVTGFHAHFLIVDDPINPEQAYSDIELKTVNRWMETTLPSRVVDKSIAVMVLVQQRLHQADPTGEILERTKGEKIKHICLPGELTKKVNPPELRERYKDGLLDPVRLSWDVLKAMRQRMGEFGYAGQVLQDPVPLGGGQFKVDCLRFKNEPHTKIIRKVRAWDKAGTELGGAYSVGVLMGVDEFNNYWVLDVVRGQWGSTERERKIRWTAEMDGYDIPILLEIEGGSGGKESGENTVRNLAGFRVEVFHATGDKETRAYPFSSMVGGNNVYVLNRGWTNDYVEEMRFFPVSRYKDQIDASSSAFNWLSRKKAVVGSYRF